MVSVIVSVYNLERYIKRCVESLRKQTFTDFEILLVDDGSTDGSAEIVERMIANEPHARLVRQANAGVSAARNRAIEMAQGEWVALLDGDDLWSPDYLKAVQMMIDRGELTPQEARSYPGKNMITRAVGTETAVQCDVFHLQPEWGETLLLCSDGLTNMMEDQEILFEIMYNEDRQACCRRLMDIAISRGAPDNVTCILVQT